MGITMVIGFVQFAAPGNEASWGHHFAAFLYFMLTAGAVAVFGSLSANLLAIEFVRSVVHDDASAPVLSLRVGPQHTVFSFIANLVLVLDAVTDIPVFLVTMLSGSYVGNLGLTMNVICNVLAVARILYLWTFMQIAHARGGEEDTDHYIQVCA